MSSARRGVAKGLLVLGVVVGGLLPWNAPAPALAAGVPEVTVTAPSAVAGRKAMLNGTVDPNGAAILGCEFEFGLGLEFERSTECTSLPAAGSHPEAVAGEASFLRVDAAYFYRLVVYAEVEPGVHETIRSKSNELLATPPTIVGEALASGVTSSAATLSGVISSGELTPNYHFEYGTSSAYGSDIPVPDATASAESSQRVSQTLTGLQPNTTYHFALVASNLGGLANVGPEATFTTRPLVAPQATTGGVEGVGQHSATLTGALDPEGLESTYYFQYGTSTAYGAIWPSLPADAGSASASVATAVAVENLQPGTAYHYRLVASNEDGTTYGSDQSFTTVPYPVSAIQATPLAPPDPAILAAAKEVARGVVVAPAKHAKHRVRAKARSKRPKRTKRKK